MRTSGRSDPDSDQPGAGHGAIAPDSSSLSSVVPVRAGGTRSTGPAVIVVAIAAFLALAILKPWSGPTTAGASPGQARASVARPETTPAPSASPKPPEDPNAMACLSADTQQLVLLERSAGTQTRSWIAVSVQPASGPLDPRLTRIVVFSEHVVGLGVCTTRDARGRLAAAARIHDVESIRNTSKGPTTADLGAPLPITLGSADADAAVLYAAPSNQNLATSSTDVLGPGPRQRPWPIGSYVIAFTFAADVATVQWLRVDLLRPAGTQ